MNTSAISSGGAFQPRQPSQTTALATEASQQKATQVQDQIVLSVIKQTQDQQQIMAQGLIKMMQSTLDIYA